MGLRIVYGRAGSGKTAFCLHEIEKRLKAAYKIDTCTKLDPCSRMDSYPGFDLCSKQDLCPESDLCSKQDFYSKLDSNSKLDRNANQSPCEKTGDVKKQGSVIDSYTENMPYPADNSFPNNEGASRGVCPLILIVPEQFSLQAEKNLAKISAFSGVPRAEALSPSLDF